MNSHLTLYFFLIVFQLYSLSIAAAETLSTLVLSQERDYHFLSDHLTGSYSLTLKKDNSYSVINREHMGVSQSDSGKWKQESSGEVVLYSEETAAYVISDSFYVEILFRDDIAELSKIKSEVRRLLDEDLEDFPIPKEPEFNPFIKLKNINAEVYFDYKNKNKNKFISRVDLMNLISDIENYQNNRNLQNIRFIPRSYKKKVFLQHTNSDLYFSSDIDEIIKEIEIQDFVPYIYFLKEEDISDKPYPFKFFSVMNKVTSHLKLN
jgi:hypothetical protein